MTIKDIKLIELPRFMDPRGNLSFVEQNNHIPFDIQRTHWIYDVPFKNHININCYISHNKDKYHIQSTKWPAC